MPSGSYIDPNVLHTGQNNTPRGSSMLKFKRAFAGRRKNNSQDFDIPSMPNTTSPEVGAIPRACSPKSGGSKFNVFTKKGMHSHLQLAPDEPDLNVPPPPPPKENFREPRSFPQAPSPAQPTEFGQVQYAGEREDWRKSNSTTHTIRPHQQVATHPQSKRERDLSPHSSSSRSHSSVSSQLPSPGSSHTSMSTYPNHPQPPERRLTKRSFTSGLLPDSLKGRRAPAQTTGVSAGQAAPPTSFRHQTPSPTPLPASPHTPWPRMHGSTDPEPARQQLQPNDQQRQNALSFTNTTLQFGKKAVGKMNFRGWGAGIARSSSPAAQSSNSSTSSLVHSGNSDGQPRGNKGKFHPQAHGSDGKKGNHSVHSFASGSGSEKEYSQPPTPSGPHLGIMLRGPLVSRGFGGLVFGRDLASATRETRIASTSLVDYNPAEPRDLENRMMPALIVRCVIHLRKWGLDEEGLFRISGRQTHIQRLKAEFDSGADWDMSDCSPAELDPHAVASVLRAYLRALPEPILTRALGPQFEAAMSIEEAVAEQNGSSVGTGGRGGPALPLSPKSRPQIIRQPSIRESIIPGGPRGPSQSLIKSIGHLIAQLPSEHHDVLQSITEIIRETAKQSKATKMPMSNLLLIFCPSLNMPPALLRLLCQCEDVWMPPTVSPRLSRQRSASESVLLSRKSSYTPASQSSENLSTPSSPFEPQISERPASDVVDPVESQTVLADPDAASIPLPSPVDTDLEDGQVPDENDDFFERESRRHTLIATSPILNEALWASQEMSSPATTSTPSPSSARLPPAPAPMMEFSSSESSANYTEGIPGKDEATRTYELIMSMKQLSESETELQRSHSLLPDDAFNQSPPALRHVVSLNLLRVNNLSQDLNGPPSARSLPLERVPGIRRRVSSRLRFSFRRKSTDMDGRMGGSLPSPLEPPVESTPPQLAPLLFDSLSLDPEGGEGGLLLNKRFSIRPTANRHSLHIRSRSTPLLKDFLSSLPTPQEGKNTDRRMSITAEHNLLLLPALRSSPLHSPAPQLDISPSPSDEDWLQSVLKAAGSSAGS